MTRTARHSNVRAIRPGLAIPQQREEDRATIITAQVAASQGQRAYRLAQTEPNSKDHRVALYMAGIDEKLPRNNLRLLVTPPTPRAEWFEEAMRKVRIARAGLDLANSQWAHARHLDLWDRGNRADALDAEHGRRQAELDLAILDALRTPVTKKRDATRKQDLIGKREWAEKYRPELQAIVDEELARFPTRPRAARKREGS